MSLSYLVRFVGVIFMLYLGLQFNSVIKESNNRSRWETSPCGTKLYSGGYILGDYFTNNKAEIVNKYFDDGKRVFEVEKIYFPDTTNPSYPALKAKIVMERSPQSCIAWKKRTGIDFSNK